jgi:hypothetical protein
MPNTNSDHLFGWDPSVWTALDDLGILLGLLTTALAVCAAVITWIRRDEVRAWLRGNRFPSVGGLARSDSHWAAILFTVSRSDVPAWVMQHSRPTWVGFIGSEVSRKAVESLRDKAIELGIRVVDPHFVGDPDDPQAAMEATRTLIAGLRRTGITNVAVDVTGGKVPMSLGAFMAAEEAGLESIYVSVEYDRGQPRPETAHIRCMSRPSRSIRRTTAAD